MTFKPWDCGLALVFAVLCQCVTGCHPVGGARSPFPSTTICEINAHPENFIGRRVLLEARYLSDGGTYTHLRDPGCAERNQMDVSSIVSKSDSSVSNFVSERKRVCATQGRPWLCTLQAKLLADVTVTMDEDGFAAVDLEKVYSFEFTDD